MKLRTISSTLYNDVFCVVFHLSHISHKITFTLYDMYILKLVNIKIKIKSCLQLCSRLALVGSDLHSHHYHHHQQYSWIHHSDHINHSKSETSYCHTYKSGPSLLSITHHL